MPIRPSHIVEALSQLGGQAHLTAIVKKVVEIVPDHSAKSPSSSVRARLQECTAASAHYKYKQDLFESVHGLGARAGYWRLKSDLLAPENQDGLLDQAEAEMEAAEGRAFLRIHLRRERSKTLVKAFKASLSSFACEACGTDMGDIYGTLGEGYIEAHHRSPLSEMQEGETTKLSDLAALCPNCHRIIHRNGLMPVEDLAQHIRKQTMPYPLAAEPEAAKWEHDAPGDGA